MGKSILPAGFVLALLSSVSAFAADLPSYKSAPAFVPPPPAFTWTGLYLDAQGGYGGWNANSSTAIASVNQIAGGRGFLGRVGGGFDYQFSDRFVAGVLADYSYGQQNGIIQDAGAGLSGNTNQNWSWAAGGRLGYLITPDLFAYGEAGFTQARFGGAALLNSATTAFSGHGTSSLTASGWFAGAGFETMFAPGWFFRTEYRYADYGSHNLVDTGALGTLESIHFHPVAQTITSGIVYKFGWPTFSAPGIPSFAMLTDGFGAAPAQTNWTGFYADAGIGYGLWTANSATRNPVTGNCIICNTQRFGGRGVFGTVGAGYDYQVTNKFVVGVLGDYDPSDMRGTIQDQANGFVGSISQQWAWGAGARIGYLVSPAVLTYTKAGFTQARFGGTNLVDTFTGAGTGAFTPGFTANGYFIGGGVEAEFAPGWFWRADYRYASYGSHDVAELGAGAAASNIHFRPEEQTATVGLVYKFNWAPPVPPAPVVAKY
jgi:outer membrane immunogenic protein